MTTPLGKDRCWAKFINSLNHPYIASMDFPLLSVSPLGDTLLSLTRSRVYCLSISNSGRASHFPIRTLASPRQANTNRASLTRKRLQVDSGIRSKPTVPRGDLIGRDERTRREPVISSAPDIQQPRRRAISASHSRTRAKRQTSGKQHDAAGLFTAAAVARAFEEAGPWEKVIATTAQHACEKRQRRNRHRRPQARLTRPCERRDGVNG